LIGTAINTAQAMSAKRLMIAIYASIYLPTNCVLVRFRWAVSNPAIRSCINKMFTTHTSNHFAHKFRCGTAMADDWKSAWPAVPFNDITKLQDRSPQRAASGFQSASAGDVAHLQQP
jgi:hypothetical protein